MLDIRGPSVHYCNTSQPTPIRVTASYYPGRLAGSNSPEAQLVRYSPLSVTRKTPYPAAFGLRRKVEARCQISSVDTGNQGNHGRQRKRSIQTTSAQRDFHASPEKRGTAQTGKHTESIWDTQVFANRKPCLSTPRDEGWEYSALMLKCVIERSMN